MSYDLRDFLMFTPEVYFRLFARLNDTLGPWLLPVAIGLLAVPVLICLRPGWARRFAIVLVALGWALTAGLFMHRYYTPINWPVGYFTWAFVLEALLLIAMALRSPPMAPRPRWALAGVTVVLLMSVLTAWSAANWKAVALPGLTPDMTALATIALLASVKRGWRLVLLIIPLLWCLFSVLTQWALGLVLPVAVPAASVVLAIVVALWPAPGPQT